MENPFIYLRVGWMPTYEGFSYGIMIGIRPWTNKPGTNCYASFLHISMAPRGKKKWRTKGWINADQSGHPYE